MIKLPTLKKYFFPEIYFKKSYRMSINGKLISKYIITHALLTLLHKASVPCRSDEFRCEHGKCIPLAHRCDKKRHCSDGTDELDCRKFEL